MTLDLTFIIDPLLLLIVGVVWYRWWARSGHTPDEPDESKRRAGQLAITEQLRIVVSGAGIIIGGAGAMAAVLTTQKEGTGQSLAPAMTDLFFAVLWGFLAVGVAAYLLGYMASPSVAHKQDVSRNRFVQVSAVVGLALLWLGGLRVLRALWVLVWNRGTGGGWTGWAP